MAFVPNLRNVRLYQNTGFNTIDAPATPSLLDSFTYVDVPAINALQITRLTSICIKATEEQVTNADYCRISDGTHSAYYAIDTSPEGGYHMEKPDTCTLNIIMDNMLTAGGVTGSNWDVLDGITERHHIAKNADMIFAYTEDDPYLTPSKPLELLFKPCIANTPSSNDKIIIEAAIDLPGLATGTPTATGYTTSGGSECVVPELPDLTDTSTATMNTDPSDTTQTASIPAPATAYYDYRNPNVKKGLARARSLGIESGAIISQYVLPANCGTIDLGSYVSGLIDKLDGTITTVVAMNDNDYKYQYATVENNRIFAGEFNKYGLISVASGNSVEFNPEDIYMVNDLSPNVVEITDPRPKGCPYFRFEYYKHNKANFFLNCIKGLNWQNAPLLYTDKSGSEIDTIRFNTDQSIKNNDMETYVQKSFLQQVDLSMPTEFSPTAGPSLGSGFVGMGIATLGGLTGTMDTSTMAAFSQTYDIGRRRQNAANQELQEFRISQNIVAPQIMFPRSEGLRDALGNGCYAYRYYLNPLDVAKFDKILTMYGYRITEPLTKAMFNVRSKFSYVKAQGVSIGGSLPKWLREGMAQELAIGKRFWKVAPDKTIYTNGGNT